MLIIDAREGNIYAAIDTAIHQDQDFRVRLNYEPTSPDVLAALADVRATLADARRDANPYRDLLDWLAAIG